MNNFRNSPANLRVPTNKLYFKWLFAATPKRCKDSPFLRKDSRFFRMSIFHSLFLRVIEIVRNYEMARNHYAGAHSAQLIQRHWQVTCAFVFKSGNVAETIASRAGRAVTHDGISMCFAASTHIGTK
jgi:hypothetical protein